MNHKLLSEIEEYLDSIEHNAGRVYLAKNFNQAEPYIKTVADCKEAVLSLFRKLDREYWELREQFEQAQAKAERYEKALKEIEQLNEYYSGNIAYRALEGER
jgi:5-bromo-4-chloroindolyl phosphate hydrolysis protein